MLGTILPACALQEPKCNPGLLGSNDENRTGIRGLESKVSGTDLMELGSESLGYAWQGNQLRLSQRQRSKRSGLGPQGSWKRIEEKKRVCR